MPQDRKYNTKSTNYRPGTSQSMGKKTINPYSKHITIEKGERISRTPRENKLIRRRMQEEMGKD